MSIAEKHTQAPSIVVTSLIFRAQEIARFCASFSPVFGSTFPGAFQLGRSQVTDFGLAADTWLTTGDTTIIDEITNITPTNFLTIASAYHKIGRC
jgi:hypothetical protein